LSGLRSRRGSNAPRDLRHLPLAAFRGVAKLLSFLLIFALLPGVSYAQSTGCSQVNALGSFTRVVTGNGTSAAFAGNAAQQSFSPGDVIYFNYGITTNSGTVGVRVSAISASGVNENYYPGPSGSTDYSTSTPGSGRLVAPANLARINFFTTTSASNAADDGSVSWTVSCTPVLTTLQAISSITTTRGSTIAAVQPVTASGGTGAGTYTYTLSGGTLPTGMNFNTSNGRLSGTASSSLPLTTFTVTVTDTTQGGAQTSSKTFQMTVNMPAPTTTAPANGARTANSTPDYAGTSQANLSVNVYVDGAQVGTTTSGAGGNWTFTQPTPLADGPHTVFARATDGGPESASSNTNTFTVDTTPPPAPVVTTPANGASTSNVTPTISGTAESGATVTVRIDGSDIGTAVATGGNWSLAAPTALGDGNHTVSAFATDAAGNQGPLSGTNSFTVDLTPPAAPTVSSPTEGQSLSANNAVTISGSTESGTTVEVLVNGGSYALANVSGTSWTYTAGTLAAGARSVTARATDAAGNVSATTVRNFTTVNAPVATSFTDSSFIGYNSGSDVTWGISVAGHVTNNPTIYAVGSSTTAQGGTVSINSSGLVTYTPPRYYRGDDSFVFTATNAGGTSPPATVTVTIDNPNFTVGLQNGSGTQGVALTNTEITVSGGRPGYTCAQAGGVLPNGLTVNADCTITGTPNSQAGNYAFNVSVTDTSLGNGPYTQQPNYLTFTLNVGTPSLSSISPRASTLAGGTTVLASGANLANVHRINFGSATVTNFLGQGTSQIQFSAPSAAAAGVSSGGSVSVTAQTSAGTSGSVTFYYLGAPMINTPSSPTSDNTPTITGSAAPNATITVSLTGPSSRSESVPATAGGSWSYTPSSGLADGNYSITAVQTLDGATSATSNAASFTVDTTPPGDPVFSSPSQGATVGSNVTFSGTTEAGTTVEISVDSGPFVSAMVNGTSWSYDVTFPSTGAHSVTVRALDTLGNTSVGATRTVNVVGAPGANNATLSVPYEGSNTIDLTSSTSGVRNQINIIATAAKGTLSVTGLTVQYTATAGEYGSDSFTYTASGAGGTSTIATVTVTIANPPVPVVAGSSVAVPYQSTGTEVDLSTLVTGVYTGTTVTRAPQHGTHAVAGNKVTYTPNAGYYGADSFEFTATGPGGTSSPAATVTLNVATPPAPSVSDLSGVTIAYDSQRTDIDLANRVTGVHSAINVTRNPVHGTFTVTNDVVRYTPNAGYYGADSFEFTATGPGGTSATAATVSLTVATPSAPVVADRNGVTVPYASTGTAIDLSSSVTGVHSGNLTTSTPANGTVTVNGDIVTYTPNPTHYGADSFTYQATGPGGTSASATVDLTVATPSAPTVTDPANVAVPYDSTGIVVDLSTSISGVRSSIAATQPTHGTTVVAGETVTYTPNADYYGADSFTYTASGPGGTSSQGTVTLTVATPAAPTVANVANVTVAYDSTGTTIDLSGSITGVRSGIAAAQPSHGTVVVAGEVVTYTPTPGYYGADSFTYTATGPGGTSSAATVSLTVATPAAPVAADKAGVAVAYNSTGTAIDLAPSITGVHASIAIGTPPAHGTTSISGDVVTYTPAAGHYGADSFTYTATGPGGTSAAATVSLIVATPPAPVAANRAGVAIAYDSTGTAIDLSGSVSGVRSSIAATQPAHGTVVVAGEVVTYTPMPGYFGADSFTYTATGPGGTSAAATVSLTVATPPAPVAADKTGVAIAYNSTGTAIDLAASISGVHTGIAVATAPAHGTVTIADDVVTYVPTSGYYGADSFTFTASGPGGTSTPATVSLTVATPAAPVAADKAGVAVAYNSAGIAIDLSGSVSGVHSSIAVATAPSHGTVTVTGDVVTYVPTSGYYGADSFTFTASGPGGTSNAATVSLTVATPAAPTTADRSGVTVAYDSPGTAIDLSGSITGVHSGIAIETAPAHGAASVTGNVVTYIPTPGYFGPDSFTWTANGPGGISTAANVSLTVATPPAPAAVPGTGSVEGRTTTAGSSVSIDLSALVSGVYDTIQIASQPAHGTVTLSGIAGPSLNPSAAVARAPFVAIYTPAVNFAGTDNFTFTATGPGGTSAPATVAITVVGQVPVATPKVARTGDGQSVSVMLTEGAVGGPFTGASVISLTPAGAATTAIIASNGGYRLDVTPNNRFGGTIVATYTLRNAFGDSLPSTVTLTVEARPDPRGDPNVGAISDAQAEAARRFARAQVSNFMRRNEQLHNGGGRAGMALGLTLGARDATGTAQRPDDSNWGLAITERMRVSGEDPAIGRYVNNPQSPLSRGDTLGNGRMFAGDPQAAVVSDKYQAANGNEDDGRRRIGSVASWAGGAIDIGTRDATTDRAKVTATTAGLSAGADIKLAEGVLVGLGGGYGNDLSRIGTAAQVRGKSTIYAAYASIQPGENLFVDGMVGRGQLDFTTRRIAAAVDRTALGKREGNYTVAALSLGIDRAGGALTWSLYGRGEYMGADLDAYAETGADRYNLRFDARRLKSFIGTLGGTIQYRQKTGFGSATPRLRAEWGHEFADVDAQWLDYADIPGAAIYALQSNGWKREQIQLSLGVRLDILKSGWSFDVETGLRAGRGEKAGTLQIRLSKEF
jgi:large repetitive protein